MDSALALDDTVSGDDFGKRTRVPSKTDDQQYFVKKKNITKFLRESPNLISADLTGLLAAGPVTYQCRR